VTPPPRYEPNGEAARELARRMAPAAEIILIRHGEPEWLSADGTSVADPPLTEYGREQARCVADFVARAKPRAIYVSPLLRAQQTAAPLAEATGLSPVTLEALAEIDVGAHGRNQEEVDRYFQEAMRRPLLEHWDGWPNGESFRNFHRRVTEGAESMLAQHQITPEKRHDFTVWNVPERRTAIAVVAHGGTNAVLLTHLLDVRPVPWEWMRFECELASHSVVHTRPLSEHGHVWSLQNFNEIDPLRCLR
jgi:probable phosphoglycerate mutase